MDRNQSLELPLKITLEICRKVNFTLEIFFAENNYYAYKSFGSIFGRIKFILKILRDLIRISGFKTSRLICSHPFIIDGQNQKDLFEKKIS